MPFAYILGLRGEKLVFLVDSKDPANEETFSPPGEPVVDYPRNWMPELGGEASFKGPDRDEWGVWFSGCVPVRDGGGKVVALLGIDYPANAWLRPLATRRMAAMVVTLSVALLVASLFSFSHRLTRGGAQSALQPCGNRSPGVCGKADRQRGGHHRRPRPHRVGERGIHENQRIHDG